MASAKEVEILDMKHASNATKRKEIMEKLNENGIDPNIVDTMQVVRIARNPGGTRHTDYKFQYGDSKPLPSLKVIFTR